MPAKSGQLPGKRGHSVLGYPLIQFGIPIVTGLAVTPQDAGRLSFEYAGGARSGVGSRLKVDQSDG
jgi:hypothetical protein